MRVVNGRSGFLVVIATLTALFLGGMVYSGGVTLGQETDVAPVSPTVAPAAPVAPAPPQAPIDNSANTAGDVNALPDAGNGGYLGQSSSSTYAVLASLGLAILAGGSLVLAYKRR